MSTVPSLLHPLGDDALSGAPEASLALTDLGLHQALAVMWDPGPDLEALFRTPAGGADAVAYRYEVWDDLGAGVVESLLRRFTQQMGSLRELLATAARARNAWQARRLVVEACSAYTAHVRSLSTGLTSACASSRALRAFGTELEAYVGSAAFAELEEGSRAVLDELGEVRYTVLVRNNRVTVTTYQGEDDYALEVARTFARFEAPGGQQYRFASSGPVELDDVEARLLDVVAELHPGPFGRLDRFAAHNGAFFHPAVVSLEKGARFYLTYLDLVAPLRARGLGVCRPQLSVGPGPTRAEGLYDLALALRAGTAANPPEVVPNDVDLAADERTVIVTGPNSGGKTTLARALGQAHYLATLGLPVPARRAELVLPDRVATSFTQKEVLDLGRSHLEHELVHLHEVLAHAGPRTVVVLNETFSSTTLRDALLLGRAVLGALAERGSLCIFVTFVEELVTSVPGAVSLAAVVGTDDRLRRTYRFTRQPPQGAVYAAALAERYGLTDLGARDQVGR